MERCEGRKAAEGCDEGRRMLVEELAYPCPPQFSCSFTAERTGKLGRARVRVEACQMRKCAPRPRDPACCLRRTGPNRINRNLLAGSGVPKTCLPSPRIQTHPDHVRPTKRTSPAAPHPSNKPGRGPETTLKPGGFCAFNSSTLTHLRSEMT